MKQRKKGKYIVVVPEERVKSARTAIGKPSRIQFPTDIQLLFSLIKYVQAYNSGGTVHTKQTGLLLSI
jgi:hypothetical protein